MLRCSERFYFNDILFLNRLEILKRTQTHVIYINWLIYIIHIHKTFLCALSFTTQFKCSRFRTLLENSYKQCASIFIWAAANKKYETQSSRGIKWTCSIIRVLCTFPSFQKIINCRTKVKTKTMQGIIIVFLTSHLLSSIYVGYWLVVLNYCSSSLVLALDIGVGPWTSLASTSTNYYVNTILMFFIFQLTYIVFKLK